MFKGKLLFFCGNGERLIPIYDVYMRLHPLNTVTLLALYILSPVARVRLIP